jgi:hypothetical protein
MNIKYTLAVYESRSPLASNIAAFLSPGKAGEILIQRGFSQGNFAEFLAILAGRAITAGETEANLIAIFKGVAAGNASQFRQICESINIQADGEKLQTLDSFWGKKRSSAAVAFASAY